MFTPQGMSRRHFMTHLAGASAMTIPALTMGHSIRTHASELKKNGKAAILLWMSGGPASIDIWDLKPGATTGGPFRPIRTSGTPCRLPTPILPYPLCRPTSGAASCR